MKIMNIILESNDNDDKNQINGCNVKDKYYLLPWNHI